MAPNGIAGIVLANGSLSSNTSNEGEIRKNLLEADLVDAIVALPDKLFYSTGIPVSLWILNRNKKNNPKYRSREHEDLGLNEDEIAFYYALTADEEVKKFMTDEILKKIAQELTLAIRNNITIDWSIRKSAQAGMRRIIKRLLKKYDYPPEQAKNALKVVMRQAEKMCGNIDVKDIQCDRVAEDKQDYLL